LSEEGPPESVNIGDLAPEVRSRILSEIEWERQALDVGGGVRRPHNKVIVTFEKSLETAEEPLEE
jgi:hypothetical protein